MLYGALVGDIVGSKYEFNNIKTKDFQLFAHDCNFTDDSVMTLAVAQAIMVSRKDGTDLASATIKAMKALGNVYPWGYGYMFKCWLAARDPQPYNSWGNGSAMRVSAVGWVGQTLGEVKRMSYAVTAITHNHPEGIKGAEATAVAVFLARTGHSKDEIRQYICDNYYQIDFTLDEIRDSYQFNESCQGTVPQALQAFFESTSFEDAIRNAISIGGDSDTLGAITGAVAEAYYGVPEKIKSLANSYLPADLRGIVDEFNHEFKKTGIYVDLVDITKLAVDAIVNAANETLLGGGGVDYAIHKAAGPELLAECRTLNGCQTGHSKITKGYNLPAKYVIHTVGPVYDYYMPDEAAELLHSCYTSALDLAKEYGCRTIAFPAISCGAYRFPYQDAVRIAVQAVRSYPDLDRHFDSIVFAVFSENLYNLYKDELL